MELSLEVTFRHMDPSAAVEARIREEAANLVRFFDRIIGCRVVVDAPHHHRKNGSGYHIGIAISVPGKDILVNHEPTLRDPRQEDGPAQREHREMHSDHEDIYVVIRDGFAAARRQLQDHSRIVRGDVKSHMSKPEQL